LENVKMNRRVGKENIRGLESWAENQVRYYSA
jgi:hypothetical protein